MMKYKGYVGQVEYDSNAKIFHGNIIGIKGAITFQGKSVDELEKAFSDSIDDYIEWCEENEVKPETPFSGNFTIRLSPEDHLAITRAAKEAGMSVNKFVGKVAVEAANSLVNSLS